jgi:ATP-binding cassette, subfamily C, bacterial LapB
VLPHLPGREHWLFGPLRANRSLYAQVGVAAAFINLFSLVSSLFIMVVYDRVLPNNATASLVALLIGVGIVLAFDFLLKTLRGYFIDIAGHRIDAEVGDAIFNRLLGMRMADRKGSAGAFAGMLREFESLREFFASATLTALVDVPFVLLFLLVIFMIGGSVVWVPLLAIPLVLVVAWLLHPILTRLSNQGLEQGLSKQGVLVETITGLETVKSMAGAPLLAERWRKAVDGHADISRQSRGFTNVGTNVAGLAQQLAAIGVVAYGVFLVNSGDLSMGGLIACSLLAGRCLAPLAQIAQLLSRISHTTTAYRQLDGMMRQAGEVREEASYLRRPKLSGAVEFRNVIFRYPGSTVRALDDVSFRIAPGERVAILGRIGSGKSTITRLILGLYEPSEGSVLVDETDVRQIHPEDLRNNMGAVLQDVFLLSGTIRENLALRNPDAGDEEVLRAAKLAGVHDFVGQLPNGYDIRLADRGEGLSGGQKQAIAMARALVGAPPVVLLDEPTASMDTNSENALISRLEQELKGRTLVLITHRASLLKLVDRVIILDRGKVVGQGPRDDVLRAAAVGAS